MDIPNQEEFFKGIKQYEEHEKRDAMYKVATFLISHFWGKTSDMADALGVLLLTWNQAFYRYGSIDFDKLEKCITKNLSKLESYRQRNISSLSDSDKEDIRVLFNEFLDALQIDSGKKGIRKSPVSVSKALHILAPDFFPLWDDKIAKAYSCYYNQDPEEQYLRFCEISKSMSEKIKHYPISSRKTILKLIDQYNYSKYTKKWI